MKFATVKYNLVIDIYVFIYFHYLLIGFGDNWVFHDKQIWQTCRIWQKSNIIVNSYLNLNFKGECNN